MARNATASPDVLVDAAWVAAHLDDPAVRLVETSEQAQLYAAGHIPGAVALDWRADLQRQSMRDFVTRAEFAELAAARGIANETTVVFYGDRGNRRAACAFWLFTLYGHRNCRILDGGRAGWEAAGRPYCHTTPNVSRAAYQAQPADLSIRAFRDQVLAHIYADRPLLDVRTPAEYTGAITRSAEDPQPVAQRAGHIPTARNIPWTAATNADGSFKPAAELRALYLAHGVTPDQPVITYSGAGERSAHTWFVLSQLLGYPDVRNYDGSWSEWGSLVRAPIEREGSSPTNDDSP